MYKELIIDPKKHSELFWSTVKSSWPETSVINEKDILGKDLNVCVVVCPLYAQGDLSTAGLIKPLKKATKLIKRIIGKESGELKVKATMGALTNTMLDKNTPLKMETNQAVLIYLSISFLS